MENIRLWYSPSSFTRGIRYDTNEIDKLAKSEYILPDGKFNDKTWNYLNLDVKSYEKTFEKVLDGKRLKDIIINRNNPIVIDLMASPGTLDELINKQILKGRGLAVSLLDHDYKEKYKNTSKLSAYEAPNIRWLQENLALPKTWKKIDDWLNEEKENKAHLIMARPIDGWDYFPENEFLYGMLLNNMWSKLDPNEGVLLFQTPKNCFLVEKYISLALIYESLRKTVDIRFDQGNSEYGVPFVTTRPTMMITKHPDSPKLLMHNVPTLLDLYK